MRSSTTLAPPEAFMQRTVRTGRLAFLLGAIIVGVAPRACAQDSQGSSAMRITGSATVSEDIYDMVSNPDTSVPPRRPPNLLRLILTPTISFGDLISLPFTIMLSSRETNTTTQAIQSPSFL